jgi:hypothetical protein
LLLASAVARLPLSFPRYDVQPASRLRAQCVAIFTIKRPTRITIATVRCLSLPSQRSRDLNGASRVASTSAVTQKSAVSGVVVCKSFSAAFTLKHRERKQASARRHGGLLLRRSAPTGLGSSRFAGPSKKADLGTWELSHARALRVVCLERLRASKELFRCMTTP